MFGAYLTLRKEQEERFFLLWTTLAVVAALWFLLTPQKWGEPRVDIMAWQHRTGFGYFTALPLALVAVRLVDGGRAYRPLLLIALALLSGSLLLSSSRGPLVGLYLSALFYCLRCAGRYRGLAAAITATTAAVIYTTTSASEFARLIRSILDFDLPSSSLYRADLYWSTFRVLPDVPLFGHGVGTAGIVLSPHTLQTYTHLNSESFVTDSDLLWLVLETGPISALMLVAVLIGGAVRLKMFSDSYRTQGTKDVARPFLLLSLVALVTFDNVLSNPLGWFLLGVVAGTTSQPRKGKVVPRSRPVLVSE